MNRIHLDKQPENIIDIGCGPGNSGQVLISSWPNAKLLGIDRSEAMIEKARKDYPRQEWVVADAIKFVSPIKFDVVFSNATIQWIPHHEKLLDGLCQLLSENGALAFQMPMFNGMPIRQCIERVAQGNRWKSKLENCASVFTFHEPGFYYDLLSSRVSSLEMWETYYLHVLESHDAIIDWIQSTGMKPYLDSLSDENEKADFRTEALNEVKRDYPAQKNGKVIFPFRRLFVIGYKRTPLKST